jgi:hypothetical protein
MVFNEGLRYAPTPWGPGDSPAVNGGVREISALGLWTDKVKTYDYPESLSILNVTEMDHSLNYGYVSRSVVQVGDTIYIRSYGEGVNTSRGMKWVNKFVGPATWNIVDDKIRDKIQGMFRKQ